MNTSLRLIELLWIAEQNNTRGSLRDSDCICERDLTSLVQEEYIHGIGHFGSGPEPGRSSCNLSRPSSYGARHSLVVFRLCNRRFLALVAIIALLNCPQRNARLQCVPADLLQ